MANPGKKLISPNGRVSFESVFETSGMEGSERKTYNVTLLIPKELEGEQKDRFDAMLEAANVVCGAKWGCDLEGKDKSGKVVKRGIRSPLRDGADKPDLDGYGEDVWFVRFVSGSPVGPGVVDQMKRPITRNSGQFYNGCWARVSFDAFGYEHPTNKGISFGLGNVQKVADGEAFGAGRTTADEDFEELEVDAIGDLEDVLS